MGAESNLSPWVAVGGTTKMLALADSIMAAVACWKKGQIIILHLGSSPLT